MSKHHQLSADESIKLDAGDETKKITSGDDLAVAALSAASGRSLPNMTNDDEVAASDELAETLSALQSVIERNATQLEKIKNELKEQREMLQNIFENDQNLQQAQEQVSALTVELKDRKAKVQGSPQAMGLKSKIGELSEQKKEVEETLSNHLVNYYQLTNSKSFDTSDGDQWDYTINARVKPRRHTKDES